MAKKINDKVEIVETNINKYINNCNYCSRVEYTSPTEPGSYIYFTFYLTFITEPGRYVYFTFLLNFCN